MAPAKKSAQAGVREQPLSRDLYAEEVLEICAGQRPEGRVLWRSAARPLERVWHGAMIPLGYRPVTRLWACRARLFERRTRCSRCPSRALLGRGADRPQPGSLVARRARRARGRARRSDRPQQHEQDEREDGSGIA